MTGNNKFKGGYKFRVIDPVISLESMSNESFVVEVQDMKTRKKLGRYPYSIARLKFGGV
jgi:hypothetical protein